MVRATWRHANDQGFKGEIEAKVAAGERLSRADGEGLYACDDLAWLGRLAHLARTTRNGDRVTFNVNRHLNLTNVCRASCAHCSFQRKPDEQGAYTMSIDEAVARAGELAGEQPTELRITNGLHPGLPWSHYLEVLRELKAALPGTSLTCFTAAEIHWFEKSSGRPADEILDELMAAGLESLAGGGAEIFDREVRQHLVDHATHWADWSRIHRLAHQKGMKTPATMRYGHIEEPRHRVDHVLRLRELQDETGGFQSFTPLRYLHDVAGPADGKTRNQLQARTTMASPADSLRTLAVSRLLLDNVAHLGCSWTTHGSSLTQLAFNFGADDLDGPVVADKAVHDAGDYGSTGVLCRADLLDLIWDAGLRPVERDTSYRVVHEYDAPPSQAERRAEPQRVWA